MFLLISSGLKGPLCAADNEEVNPAGYPFDIHYVLFNTEFTLLHELGHALIAELKIPVLGREEDAADQLATILLLASRDGLRGSLIQKVRSIGIELRIEAVEDEVTYWDSHSPAIQRFYNILCLAYGMNPEPFAGFVESNWLPFERGWYCDIEHQQALSALRWIYFQYGRPDRPPLPGISVPLDRPFPDVPSVGRQLEAMNKSLHPDHPGKISVQYDNPTTLNGELLLQKLKDSNLAENFADQVERSFYLPRDLVINFTDCNQDAYWNGRSGHVVFCYSLLETYYRHAKKAENLEKMIPYNSTPLDFVLPKEIYEALKVRAEKDRVTIEEVTIEALKSYLKAPSERQELQKH